MRHRRQSQINHIDIAILSRIELCDLLHQIFRQPIPIAIQTGMFIGNRQCLRTKSLILHPDRCNRTRHHKFAASAIHQIAHQTPRALHIDDQRVALRTTTGHSREMNHNINRLIIELLQIFKRAKLAVHPWQIQLWIFSAHANYPVIFCH